MSHSFSDDHHRGGLSLFRSAMSRVVTEVQRRLPNAARVDVQFAMDRYGKSLFDEMLNEIKAADIAIVDLNGLRPNVLLEAGVRLGTGAAPVVIADKVLWDPRKVPTELAHLLVGFYDGPDDLLRLLEVPLRAQLEGALANIHRFTTRDIWFGDKVGEIHVVCAPEPERSSFASRANPNYLFIDNLEDRDALFEVAILASRLYPSATLTRHASATVTPDVLKRNLIVIGGPGFNVTEGNTIARELIRARGLSVRYGEDEGGLFEFQGHRYSPSVQNSGQVDCDYGYFARIRNPLNSESSVVVAQGVYTAGTLGACIAFSDDPDAAGNHEWLREKVPPGSEFEVLVQVDVGLGGVVTPAGVTPLRASVLERQ